jgi:hypothetical protein
MTRARAVRTSHRIDEMMQFFAEEPKVRKLKIWGYDKENMSDNLYKEARALNADKLKRAREGGKFWGDEDDLDIEGERVFREIDSLKHQLVSAHFYDGEIQ